METNISCKTEENLLKLDDSLMRMFSLSEINNNEVKK